MMHDNEGYNSASNSDLHCEIKELKTKIKELEFKLKISNKDEDLYDILMKMQAEINDNKQVIQNLIKSWNHRASQIAECCK
jgi:predicted DNA-binding protein YlxM (UPF0122 family)